MQIINKVKLYFFMLIKTVLILFEEIISIIQKSPKIIGGMFLCFGIFSSIQIVSQGYFLQAIKLLLSFMVIATAVYYISIVLYKPLAKHINKLIEKIRLHHHNINCGIYVLQYKNKIEQIDDIDKMLNIKELLETNIILSSLKLKIKAIFDETNIINYQNILTNGLQTGSVLCFSSSSKINDNKNKIVETEFVIDTDVFIKEFNEFCKDNPNDIEKQIEFIKNKQKNIKKSL